MSDLRVFAPGSMTHLMPRLVQLYQRAHPVSIHTTFGPSGSLRAKIESGAQFDIFMSASTTHTEALHRSGHLNQTDLLGFNAMVLLYQADLNLTQETIVPTLIDPTISVGMSTTGLDPSRDDAIEILAKVSRFSGVPLATIEQKIRMITGGRESPNAPLGRNQYGWLMETQDIQVLLTYLSNALVAIEDNAHIRFTELPSEIAVTGQYGIGLAGSARSPAEHFYAWLLDMDAQRILKECGFRYAH